MAGRQRLPVVSSLIRAGPSRARAPRGARADGRSRGAVQADAIDAIARARRRAERSAVRAFAATVRPAAPIPTPAWRLTPGAAPLAALRLAGAAELRPSPWPPAARRAADGAADGAAATAAAPSLAERREGRRQRRCEAGGVEGACAKLEAALRSEPALAEAALRDALAALPAAAGGARQHAVLCAISGCAQGGAAADAAAVVERLAADEPAARGQRVSDALVEVLCRARDGPAALRVIRGSDHGRGSERSWAAVLMLAGRQADVALAIEAAAGSADAGVSGRIVFDALLWTERRCFGPRGDDLAQADARAQAECAAEAERLFDAGEDARLISAHREAADFFRLSVEMCAAFADWSAGTRKLPPVHVDYSRWHLMQAQLRCRPPVGSWSATTWSRLLQLECRPAETAKLLPALDARLAGRGWPCNLLTARIAAQLRVPTISAEPEDVALEMLTECLYRQRCPPSAVSLPRAKRRQTQAKHGDQLVLRRASGKVDWAFNNWADGKQSSYGRLEHADGKRSTYVHESDVLLSGLRRETLSAGVPVVFDVVERMSGCGPRQYAVNIVANVDRATTACEGWSCPSLDESMLNSLAVAFATSGHVVHALHTTRLAAAAGATVSRRARRELLRGSLSLEETGSSAVAAVAEAMRPRPQDGSKSLLAAELDRLWADLDLQTDGDDATMKPLLEQLLMELTEQPIHKF